MTHLKDAGAINSWRMLRCKLNLAYGNHRDFLLEIEMSDLTQLDLAFRESGKQGEDVARLHRAVHDLSQTVHLAFTAPFLIPNDQSGWR